jgi:predicted LPLAT superfamily acyltransferase
MKTKQRGSGWSIKLAFNLYKIFGYKLVYYIMYPVTFFYFLFASNVKDALKIYYEHLNITFTNKIYYEHLRMFAICMVDRFIAKIDPKTYLFEFSDIDTQKKILDQGAIILYSHFGGWAASSNFPIVNSKINIVMQEVLIEGIKEIEKEIENKTNINIIDLNSGTLNVSIQVANALMDNEIVVMMADRTANKKSSLQIEFLNEKANFNKNPFQIAYKTNKPLLVYFIVLTGMRKYKVVHINITIDKTKKEDEAILIALKEYTNEYEEMIKMYPSQWLNFYDFWEKR